MADVFISYSKVDRLAVESLAALLQSRGWSVWWDRRLVAGDEYRDDILRELDAARVVVVVWSKSSAGSEWVRAEAARAKAGNKLVPVSYGGIRHEEIPLPFGEMHIEPWDRQEEIAAAVARLLSAPRSELGWHAKALAGLRFNLLSWIGIIGGALTVFGALRGLITLSEWAAVVAEHWHLWLHNAWSLAFDWLRVDLPRPLTALMSLLMFGVALAFGARQAAPAGSKNEVANVGASVAIWSAFGVLIPGGIALFSWMVLEIFSLIGTPDSSSSLAVKQDGFQRLYVLYFVFSILGVFLLAAPFHILRKRQLRKDLASRFALAVLLVPMCCAVLLQPTLRYGDVKRAAERHAQTLSADMTRGELMQVKQEIADELKKGRDNELERLAKLVDERMARLRRECAWLVFECKEISRAPPTPVGVRTDPWLAFETWSTSSQMLGAMAAGWLLFVTFISVAPHIALIALVNARLMKTLVGVGLLIGLNYLSVYAPMLKQVIA